MLAANHGGLRRELEDLLVQFPVMREQVPAAVLQMLEARGPDQEAPVERGATIGDPLELDGSSEDEEPQYNLVQEAVAAARLNVAVAEQRVSAAEQQQQYREEEAAREADRERRRQQAVLAEYAARDCPCCLGDIEKRTVMQQELIDFSRGGGIRGAHDR